MHYSTDTYSLNTSNTNLYLYNMATLAMPWGGVQQMGQGLAKLLDKVCQWKALCSPGSWGASGHRGGWAALPHWLLSPPSCGAQWGHLWVERKCLGFMSTGSHMSGQIHADTYEDLRLNVYEETLIGWNNFSLLSWFSWWCWLIHLPSESCDAWWEPKKVYLPPVTSMR